MRLLQARPDGFSAVVQPLLTQQESVLLDICERLEPRITTALEEASAHMMEALARSTSMDGSTSLQGCAATTCGIPGRLSLDASRLGTAVGDAWNFA